MPITACRPICMAVAFRKGLRRCLDIPYYSHSFLLPGLTDCDSWSVSLFWCFHVSWVVAVFFCTPFVYGRIRVHVQWTGTVAPVGPCDNHMIVAWLSRQLICSESVVSRILVEREGEYIVVSQQFAGIKNFVSRFVVKTGGKYTVYTIWTLKSEPTLVVVESTDVVASTDVLETREVRLETRWTCWRRERFERDRLTTREFDRWREESVTSSQPILLPGELGSTVPSFGSSPTESPADVTDDRPPWSTRYWGIFCFYYSFIL